MRKFFQEFQAFISKGNVLDLAVAVIIGAAFSKIVDSLVKDIINPILGVLVGRPVFGYGAFLTAIVQFLLLAFAVFWLIKIVVTARTRIAAEADRLLNAKHKEEEEAKAAAQAAAPAPAPAPAPSAEELELLREIRDLLKAQKGTAVKDE